MDNMVSLARSDEFLDRRITDRVQMRDPETNTLVVAEIVNDANGFFWRLVVDGDASPFSKYYAGILVHKGYAYATAYWTGALPVETPFKIVQLKKVTTK